MARGAWWLALIVSAVQATAAMPNLAPDSVTGAPGQTVSIPLRLTGAALSSAGFNATVYLPAEATLTGVVRGSLLPSPDFVLVAQALSDPAVNAVAVFGYSITRTISSTGTLCTLQVAIPPDTGPGDYPIVLNAADRSPTVRGSHALSGVNGSNSVAHSVADAVLSVRIPGMAGDSNGNGIPDAWEIRSFGVVTNVNDHTDWDHDGLSDYLEYLSDTDPTNSASCLAIAACTASCLDGARVELKWYSITGATYRIERSETLGLGGFTRAGLDQSATPPVNTCIDQPPAGTAPYFYRVILLGD